MAETTREEAERIGSAVVIGPGPSTGGPTPPDFLGGFDADYTAPTYVQPDDFASMFGDPLAGSYDRPARYTEGEQWQFAGNSPEYISSLQSSLVNAGFLSVKDITSQGVWFEAEAKAMENLMTAANGNGMDWEQALAYAVQGGQFRRAASGAAAGGARRPSVRLSNPDDLRKSFRNTARQATGGVFIDGTQVDQMVKAYQEIERQTQNAVIDGQASVENAPSPEGFAIDEIAKRDPRGEMAIQGNRFAQMASMLEQMTLGADMAVSEGFDWDLIRNLVEFDKVVRERFPSWAWALDHAELGPLIRRAAGEEEWSADLFQSQIEATGWWTTRTEAQRSWDIAMESEGEADMERRIEVAQAAMSDAAASMGVTLDEAQLRDLTVRSLRNGWTADENTGALVSSTDEFAPGDFTASVTGIRGAAADYMIDVDDGTARSLARKMATGEMTEAGLTEYMRGIAKQRYPSEQITKMLDEGVSMQEYFAPHTNALSGMLGRRVDLREPEFRSVLSIRDDKGTVAPMTLGQVEQYGRTLDEFWGTPQGRAEQATMGRGLLRHMGVISA